MRIVATAICALTLAGCASDLPYLIAIGNPNKAKDGPGHTECVVRLDKIVENIALNYSSSKLHDVKSVHVEFEKQLRHGTQIKFRTPPEEISPLEDRMIRSTRCLAHNYRGTSS